MSHINKIINDYFYDKWINEYIDFHMSISQIEKLLFEYVFL